LEKRRGRRGYEAMYREAYAEGERLFWPRGPSGGARDLVRLLEEEGPARKLVLDVGCGEGRDSVFLARRGCIVHGVDVATSAVRRAVRRSREEGVQEATHFIAADATRLPYRTQSFHVILDTFTLNFIHDKVGYVQELARTIKPGGTISLEEKGPASEVHYVTTKELEELFQRDFMVRTLVELRRGEKVRMLAFRKGCAPDSTPVMT